MYRCRSAIYKNFDSIFLCRNRKQAAGRNQARCSVCLPMHQQLKSPSIFLEETEKNSSKLFKGCDSVDNLNKWDCMICLVNVEFWVNICTYWNIPICTDSVPQVISWSLYVCFTSCFKLMNHLYHWIVFYNFLNLPDNILKHIIIFLNISYILNIKNFHK